MGVYTHTHTHTTPESLAIHSLLGQTDAKIILIKCRNSYVSDTQKRPGIREMSPTPSTKLVLVVEGGVGRHIWTGVLGMSALHFKR